MEGHARQRFAFMTGTGCDVSAEFHKHEDEVAAYVIACLCKWRSYPPVGLKAGVMDCKVRGVSHEEDVDWGDVVKARCVGWPKKDCMVRGMSHEEDVGWGDVI